MIQWLSLTNATNLVATQVTKHRQINKTTLKGHASILSHPLTNDVWDQMVAIFRPHYQIHVIDLLSFNKLMNWSLFLLALRWKYATFASDVCCLIGTRSLPERNMVYLVEAYIGHRPRRLKTWCKFMDMKRGARWLIDARWHKCDLFWLTWYLSNVCHEANTAYRIM